ncbi:MAG: hypothetical protein EXS08_08145 [Planctomycetes bacterium]|nr:hypothetical protein [Planctomycetota bacterium]
MSSERPCVALHPNVRFARGLHQAVLWLERRAIPVLVGLTVATLVLGFIGAYGTRGKCEHELGFEENLTPARALYEAVQVLVFNWPEKGDNYWIVWARVGAVFTGLFGAAELVRRFFDLLLQRLLIRWSYRGHVVLCGLDEATLSLGASLVESGFAVVAITPGMSPLVTRARTLGVLVHLGDPLDPEELEAVHVDGASWVVAMGGDVRIPAAAHRCGAKHNSSLCCLLAQPRDTLLEPRPMLLTQRWLTEKRMPVIQLNVLDRLAAYVLAESGVFRHVFECATQKELRARAPRVRSILIVGEGLFTERLASVLVWDASVVYAGVAERQVVAVTLVHPRAQAVAGSLARELATRLPPELILALTPRACEKPLEAVLGERELLLEADEPSARFDLVVLHFGTNERTLAAAEPIVRRLFEKPLRRHPVVLAVLEGDDGRARSLDALEIQPWTLARQAGASSGGVEGRALYMYDCWKRVLTSERLLGPLGATDEVRTEAVERLARRAHRAYRDRDRKDPMTDGEARADWDNKDMTPEEFQESSRQFARDIERKLAMLGCSLRYVGHGRSPPVEFSEIEIECFARAEHERWLVERWERGWRTDELDAVAKRVSTSLIPWDELIVDKQDIDREFIRKLQPKILAPEGFVVERWPSAPRAMGET